MVIKEEWMTIIFFTELNKIKRYKFYKYNKEFIKWSASIVSSW